jgi:hypothetical protein
MNIISQFLSYRVAVRESMTAMAALMTIAVDMDGNKRYFIIAVNKFTSLAKFKFITYAITLI